MSHVYLKQMEIGPMQNFVYFVGDADKKEVAIVDPAWDIDKVLQEADREGLKIKAILITHFHFDHTNGIPLVLQKVDVPIYVNENEIPYLKDEFNMKNFKACQSGDKVQLGNGEITLLHTPSHTPGSQCFHIQDMLVSGDTLFINCVGRTDLPGGNPEQMYQSIANVLMKLDNQTILFPGHNYADHSTSTLGKEKENNPFFLCESLGDFLKLT